MKKFPPILLILLTACAAPISYVNNFPRSSKLEEKGDFVVFGNVGYDAYSLSDYFYQIGTGWSPVDHFGVEMEYAGSLNLNQEEQNLSQIKFIEGSLIYYHPIRDNSNVEFKLGIGRGNLNGVIDYQFFNYLESYDVNSEYLTHSIQVNYNSLAPNGKTRTSAGLRFRNVHFDEYRYTHIINGEMEAKSFQKDDWNVIVLNPFFEINQRITKNLGLNFSTSYSFLRGQRQEGFVHPHFSKLGLTIGVQLKF